MRAALLVRHDEVRGLVARTVGRADVRSDAELEADARRLARGVEELLAFEEQALPPALRDVIGWGAVLQAQIEEDHRRQRAALATARSALATPRSRAALTDAVRALAAEVLRDLDDEDDALMNASLDALVSDSAGG
jgi:hypothetical protein